MSNFLIDLKTSVLAKLGVGAEQPARGTGYNSLAVAQVEPAGFELARAGLRFGGGCQVIASGIAPVAAIPTTTATLFLYNNEPEGSGRVMVVDSLTAILGSGTAAAGNALMFAVSKAETKPTAASNYSSQSLSDGGQTTRAIWATGVTITAPVWLAAQGMQLAAAANVGQGHGLGTLPSGILIPPKHGLAIAILGGSGTSPLFSVFATWYEAEADLG